MADSAKAALDLFVLGTADTNIDCKLGAIFISAKASVVGAAVVFELVAPVLMTVIFSGEFPRLLWPPSYFNDGQTRSRSADRFLFGALTVT